MALVQDSFGDDVTSAMPGDYFALMKPRVMSLVVFTAFVGLWLAPVSMGPVMATIAILAIAIGAGASGALNMWYDAETDAVMGRTSLRPIPAGLVGSEAALTFGLILAAFSVATLGLFVNWLAASLLAFTIFFYAVVYTMWLKRATPQNIVIGGAAGAFPPVIGWAAATNAVSLEPLILFAIIFLWTPPHFWALALFKSGDYGRAGIPMMPNVAGNRSTQRQILVYAVLVSIAGVLPYAIGFAGPAYGAIATALGAVFVYYAVQVARMQPSDERMLPARKLFGFSIFYLFAIFAALLVENMVLGLMR